MPMGDETLQEQIPCVYQPGRRFNVCLDSGCVPGEQKAEFVRLQAQCVYLFACACGLFACACGLYAGVCEMLAVQLQHEHFY